MSSRTREVFDAFAEGRLTVTQLQQKLNVASKTLYYQVRKLVQVGLLRETGMVKNAAREAVAYERPFAEWRIPPGYQGLEYERLAAKAAEIALSRAARRFRAVSESSESNPSLVDDQFLKNLTIRLSTEDRELLRSKLNALASEFTAKQVPGERTISMVVVISPLI
ncbi:MAG: helix-turn-helix transcriptional regulator [Chlorobia bacterium]|nr:helix-turn-helix transcriptional regulator [Fimbriimonadaceae bacterium]